MQTLYIRKYLVRYFIFQKVVKWCTGIIILYNERVQEYKKVLNCRRLNGIVHCFTYKDFKNCCEKLVLPKDIMEYIAYREKYIEMDRICKEEESNVVDKFLVEKYGTNKFEPDELYIFRWFLNNYKDKLESDNRKQYREIIEVFLELDRAGVDAFSQRLGKIISLAKKSINSPLYKFFHKKVSYRAF